MEYPFLIFIWTKQHQHTFDFQGRLNFFVQPHTRFQNSCTIPNALQCSRKEYDKCNLILFNFWAIYLYVIVCVCVWRFELSKARNSYLVRARLSVCECVCAFVYTHLLLQMVCARHQPPVLCKLCATVHNVMTRVNVCVCVCV